MKIFLKYFLLMLLFGVSYLVSHAVLPYSSSFRELSGSVPAYAVVFMFLYAFWNTGLVFYVAKQSVVGKAKTAGILFIYLFFIQFVLTQMETLFFGGRFHSLTTFDIWLLIAGGIVPTAALAIVGSLLFCKSSIVSSSFSFSGANFIKKLTFIACLYVVIYFVFGYFVAWQFEEVRVFYSDTTEKVSFAAQLLENLRTQPAIFPFQIFRGYLFGLAAFLLLAPFHPESQRNFVLANTIGFSAIGIVLLIPNPLFPELVRLAHFLEVTSSMILFGFLTGKMLGR